MKSFTFLLHCCGGGGGVSFAIIFALVGIDCFYCWFFLFRWFLLLVFFSFFVSFLFSVCLVSHGLSSWVGFKGSVKYGNW